MDCERKVFWSCSSCNTCIAECPTRVHGRTRRGGTRASVHKELVLAVLEDAGVS